MQNNKSFDWDKFSHTPIVAILRGYDLETIQSIARSYSAAGFYALEVTMNTVGAAEIIDLLQKEFDALSIGAGTVCTMPDLEAALAAGAQFIVTPILDEQIVQHCVQENIPVFPGAYTPTEIYRAWSAGASAVKVFPAAQLGAKYIKDVLAPLNEIRLLPTGGVSLENIGDYFEAGAAGVGMGSSLLDKKLIEREDYDGLKDHFLKLAEQIK